MDLVYLWVDGSDPRWQAKRRATVGGGKANPMTDGKGRYANNDELKYSLRSVERYAPWVRRIFIVTDEQTPSWLDTSNPKIQIVDHKEILPPQSLPCFNSCLIEHFLYHIPGLSEHFIYANDDMLLNKPVSPSDFFAPDGYPIVRLNHRYLGKLGYWIKHTLLGKPVSNYNRTVHRAATLVEEKYGRYYSGKAHHNIDAYRKSDYQATAEEFAPHIEQMLENHVRKDNDVQRALYSYVPLAKGHAHQQYVTRSTSFRVHIQNESHYGKLLKWNPTFFCMNDSEYATDADRAHAREFLETLFPDKSHFEK